jgi:hypothetical protein
MNTDTPRLAPLILVGHGCIGFLMKLGPRGFEAFDLGEKSLGVYATVLEAVEAIEQARPLRGAAHH